MPTIVRSGTQRIEVKEPDSTGVGFVPESVGPDEIVLLTARSTNQGSPPNGAGPLYSPSWRPAYEGFEIIVCKVCQSAVHDIVVSVDWAIVKP